MFGLRFGSETSALSILEAIDRSLATVEFDPTGKILRANDNFCQTVGYEPSEVIGQHHRMFVAPAYAQSADYRTFWDKLGGGQYDAGEYRRVGKGGRDIWLQATYNPVKAGNGSVLKIVKVASDITKEKARSLDLDARIQATSRVQGTIEFTPDGEILTANQNFLAVIGYRLDEIVGNKHAMLVEPEYGRSSEYKDFWRKLKMGEFQAGEFKRVGKNDKVIWIQASYNPIFDHDSKVVRVVKYATDVTERVAAVEAIGGGLSKLAHGDVEFRLDTPFIPAFEPLRADFNSSMVRMQSSLQGVGQTAEAIAAGAREISAATDDLSRRTETQAANLQETATALDHITTTMKASAAGADEASRVVATANDDAKQSSAVVGQTIEAMDSIAKSAQQINQIIGVIDEIAFQTNLLALNAGVEAARAGEAGRGFAVVASEVRALAQRSAQAAKEIKSLIMTSTTQVDQGVNLVAETGRSLERIMRQVREINSLVTAIAAGAREQASGLSEVNIAMNQMDKVTQQNAAMVQETTAASHELSSKSQRLNELVGFFNVGRVEAPTVRHMPSKRPSYEKPAPRAPVRAVKLAVNAPAPSRSDTDNWEEF